MKKIGFLLIALILFLNIGCNNQETDLIEHENDMCFHDSSIEESIVEALNPDGSKLPPPEKIMVFRKAEIDDGAAVLASVLPAQSDTWTLSLYLLDRNGSVTEQYADNGWVSLGVSLNRVTRTNETILFGACHNGLWFKGEDAPPRTRT